MKQINYKKLILPNIPYVFFVYLFDKVGQAVRLAPGADISAKILNITQGFSAAFESALPSIYPLSICIMLVVYGRMIEIYLVTSVAPIPMATMVNHEWGSMGQNYLKSLLALGFQAFLILVCVGIYAVLIQTIAATDDISGAIWACMGYTVLLCFTLFKTGSLAKSVFSAH